MYVTWQESLHVTVQKDKIAMVTKINEIFAFCPHFSLQIYLFIYY